MESAETLAARQQRCQSLPEPRVRRSSFSTSIDPTRVRFFSEAISSVKKASRVTIFATATNIDVPEADSLTGLTYWEAASSLVITMVGAGVNVLPSCAATMGYLPAPLLMILTGLLVTECGMLLCWACSMAELSSQSREGSLATYEALAKITSGPRCEHLLRISKDSVLLMACAIYVNLETQCAGSFYNTLFSQNTKKPLIGWIIMPLFVVLAWLKDLKQISRLSLLGVLGVVAQCGAAVVGSFFDIWTSWDCSSVEACANHSAGPPGDSILKSLGGGVATFFFGLAVLSTIPSVRSQMAEPQLMPSVLRISMLIVIGIYLLVMCSGYAAYGDSIPESNVILAVSKNNPRLGMLASVGLTVNSLLTVPIIYFIVVSGFEATGNDEIRTPMSLPNLICRAAGMVLLVSIAWATGDDMLIVIGLFSSLFIVFNNVFLPIWIFLLAATFE